MFESLPISANIVVIAVAAVVVWMSGTRLSLTADAISDRTGFGRAFVGALFLGGATSLPEMATTLTASALGNAPLAINNLLGGVAMQLAVLAVIDLVLVRGALTYFAPYPVLLLSGVLLVLQISVAMVAIVAGDISTPLRIGVWPAILTVSYFASLHFLRHFETRTNWVPADIPDALRDQDDKPESRFARGESPSGKTIAVHFSANCLLILAGGWAVASAADALAHQTGLASGFLGATLVAATTSLPEVSTTAGAVRVGAYSLAITNIFGTNTLEIALLFPADLLYREGAIVNAVDQSALLMGGVAIFLTASYLWGMLERRNQTIFRMGIDSFLVLSGYLVAIVLLYLQSS